VGTATGKQVLATRTEEQGPLDDKSLASGVSKASPDLLDLIRRAADRLEDRTPEEILTWSLKEFPGRTTLATGFGAEGVALIDMAIKIDLGVDIFSLDTGFFFPETYELWEQIESRYGVKIRRMTPVLTADEQDRLHGPRLWERSPDQCCGIRKIEPLRRALDGFDGWITAIRRDQTAARASARVVDWDGKWQLVKVNPLAKWTRRDVWRYIVGNDLPYNPLHDIGYSSIGCVHCTRAVKPGEDDRAGRWSGHQKTECGLHESNVAVNLKTEAAGAV
jgi:phosphoadenosine phosphosulfate reductase